MSEQVQWFVLQGEEQLGPYTGEQLMEFAAQGNIVPETQVWAEGLEGWLPAAQVEGLFPAAASAAPPPAVADYPRVGVGGASFGMWAGLLLGGIALSLVALVLLAISSGHERPNEAAQIIIICLAGVGYLLVLISGIVWLVYLHRAWKCLQPGGLARTTPGKAIGLLFIPFFNLYWLFQAVHGLGVDWNRTVDSYPDLKAAPRFSEGLLLTYCILSLLFPPGAFFLAFPVMSRICRGISFFAFRPVHHAPGQAGFSLR